MKTQAEQIIIKEDIMIPIYLSNGSFETNEELFPVIQRSALALGLSTVEDIEAFTEETFFEIHSSNECPLWIKIVHYGSD